MGDTLIHEPEANFAKLSTNLGCGLVRLHYGVAYG
jgi:hypothetical protein